MTRSLLSAMLLAKTYLVSSILMAITAFSAPGYTAEATQEQQLKAVLIYRMGSYVTWQNKPLNITYCFVGDQSHKIGKVLSDRQKIGKLPDNIKVMNKDSYTSQTAMECSVVYIPDEFEIAKDTLDSISKSVFTITDSSKALNEGFIASIEIHKNKPLLSISKENLKNSNVSVNSRFLSWVKLL